jgi:hypothetical protein
MNLLLKSSVIGSYEFGRKLRCVTPCPKNRKTQRLTYSKECADFVDNTASVA